MPNHLMRDLAEIELLAQTDGEFAHYAAHIYLGTYEKYRPLNLHNLPDARDRIIAYLERAIELGYETSRHTLNKLYRHWKAEEMRVEPSRPSMGLGQG